MLFFPAAIPQIKTFHAVVIMKAQATKSMRRYFSMICAKLLAISLILSLIAIAFFSLALRAVLAQTTNAKGDDLISTTSAKKKQEDEPAVEAVSTFTIAAPYWSTEDGFVSTIEMKNNRIDASLTVTPVLYPLHGQKILLEPVKFKPSETRLLDINKALGKKGKSQGTGAVEIFSRQALMSSILRLKTALRPASLETTGASKETTTQLSRSKTSRMRRQLAGSPCSMIVGRKVTGCCRSHCKPVRRA